MWRTRSKARSVPNRCVKPTFKLNIQVVLQYGSITTLRSRICMNRSDKCLVATTVSVKSRHDIFDNVLDQRRVFRNSHHCEFLWIDVLCWSKVFVMWKKIFSMHQKCQEATDNFQSQWCRSKALWIQGNYWLRRKLTGFNSRIYKLKAMFSICSCLNKAWYDTHITA